MASMGGPVLRLEPGVLGSPPFCALSLLLFSSFLRVFFFLFFIFSPSYFNLALAPIGSIPPTSHRTFTVLAFGRTTSGPTLVVVMQNNLTFPTGTLNSQL